jgi:hypothetical protein
MMSENIARNMWSSQGTIDYPTLLHLVGQFRILHLDAWNHEYKDTGGITGGLHDINCIKNFKERGLI